MKNIYELKASKYKYKYKKLLQELVGGTLAQQEAEYEEYTIVQKESNGVLPEQTFEDYLRTKAEYENYKITQSKAPSVLVYISSYLDFMRLEEELRRSNPILRKREERRKGFQAYERLQKEKSGQLPLQTFEDYLQTIADYETYLIQRIQAPRILPYMSYENFIGHTAYVQAQRQAQRQIQLPNQTLDQYLQTIADYERYISEQQVPNLSYIDFMELNERRRINDEARAQVQQEISRLSILLQDKKSRNTDNAKQFAAKIADEEKTRGSRFRNAQ